MKELLKEKELNNMVKYGYRIEYVIAEGAGATIAFLQASNGYVFEGRAFLKNGEEWNRELGKRVARNKAIRQYKRFLRRNYYAIAEEYDNKASVLRRKASKASVSVSRIDESFINEDVFKIGG